MDFPQTRSFRGVMYLRKIAPPPIAQLSRTVTSASRITEQVMEKSQDPVIRDFRRYLDRTAARAPTPMQKLALINAHVNRSVRQEEDATLYLRGDLWAPPLSTLLIGGDCEDLAILKHWALRRLGFAPENLFLVAGVTLALQPPQFHALLVVSLAAEQVAILDNLSDRLARDKAEARFDPVYAINQFGFWLVERPDPANARYWNEVARHVQP